MLNRLQILNVHMLIKYRGLMSIKWWTTYKLYLIVPMQAICLIYIASHDWSITRRPKKNRIKQKSAVLVIKIMGDAYRSGKMLTETKYG